MNHILDKIIADKKREVNQLKAEKGIRELEKEAGFERQPVSLKKSLEEEIGIIAEFKRKSPSAGWISRYADPESVTLEYIRAGARALSVLTDRKYFAGSRDDLLRAREVNRCPILRKDFIVDDYQVLESRAMGADAILLIAAVLDKTRVRELAAKAHSVGLEVLLEIHESHELEHLDGKIDLVGVNNRNLKRMETDVQTSIDLAGRIPEDFVKISESGIHDPQTIHYLKSLGYRGFLIGEYFMRQEQPGKACRNFIRELNKLQGSAPEY